MYNDCAFPPPTNTQILCDNLVCLEIAALSLSLFLSLSLTLTNSLSLPSNPSLQGDGISYETIANILEHMKVNQWSADNVTFGSGGALLQRLHRDTQKCAYKCSYAIINGEGVSEYKFREHPCTCMSSRPTLWIVHGKSNVGRDGTLCYFLCKGQFSGFVVYKKFIACTFLMRTLYMHDIIYVHDSFSLMCVLQ